MNKGDFFEEILSLPVWDTHTHLDGSAKLCAQNIVAKLCSIRDSGLN